jgi:uncharacterized RDD family membrane protein YckC
MTDAPERCGLGIRGVAMTIDSVVWFALFFVATFPVAAATGQLETTASGANASLEGVPGTAAFVLWLALGLGYHTLFEWQFGKTLGKYLVGIRAANEDGSALSLRSSLIRNVARLVDFLPAFYVVGIVALVLSDEHERLGDRFAGTVVVR